MEKFIQWFDTSKYYFIGAAIVIVILLIILLQIFVLSRRRYRHQTKDLENRYNSNHAELTGEIITSINRLESISKNNVIYIQIHSEYFTRYNNLLTSQDKQSFLIINSLKDLLNEKNYKGLKQIIESSKITINEYTKLVSILINDLANLLKSDEECRQFAIAEKEKYRNLKEDYAIHETELKSLEVPLTTVITGIEKMFFNFEEHLDAAEYEEAKQKLPIIQKIIDELTRIMIDLPYLATLVELLLPKKIMELSDAYAALEKENYPLHHLKVSTTIETIKLQLDSIRKDLAQFKVDDIREKTDNIDQMIDNFFMQFSAEKEAKIEFDLTCEDVSNDTFLLEKEFSKLKRSLPEYKTIFVIDEKYVDQIAYIQNDIDRMGMLKRDLDTYIHSSTRQPYSMLLKKMKDLRFEISKIQGAVKDFYEYLDNLKKSSDSIYLSVSSYFRTLKILEAKIRSLNVQALSDCYALRFVQAYEYLNRLHEILSAQPLNVTELNDTNGKTFLHVSELKEEVNEQLELATVAENSIVYANSYRQEFNDARIVLSKAEASFLESDFGRTADENVKIIKQLHPEVSK